jgi:phasin family protein
MSSSSNYKNMFSSFNWFQPIDFNSFKNIASKNMEIINTANQILVEGAQAALRRNAETVQSQAQKSFECIRNCTSSSSPEDWSKARSEFLTSSVENMSSYAKEVVEISSKAALECLEVYQKRASEIASEISSNSCSSSNSASSARSSNSSKN